MTSILWCWSSQTRGSVGPDLGLKRLRVVLLSADDKSCRLRYVGKRRRGVVVALVKF